MDKFVSCDTEKKNDEEVDNLSQNPIEALSQYFDEHDLNISH